MLEFAVKPRNEGTLSKERAEKSVGTNKPSADSIPVQFIEIRNFGQIGTHHMSIPFKNCCGYNHRGNARAVVNYCCFQNHGTDPFNQTVVPQFVNVEQ